MTKTTMNRIIKTLPDVQLISILGISCFISLSWQYFSVFILAFCCYFFVTNTINKSLSITVFLIPFHNVLRITDFTIMVYLIYSIFLFVAFLKLLHKNKLTINKTILYILLAILLYSLLPFGSYKLIRWRWISTFFIIIFTCFLIKNSKDEINLSSVAYYLFFGIVISSAFRGMLDSYEFVNKFQLNVADRFEALMINTNYFSEACIMLASMLLVVLYKYEHKIFTTICFAITTLLGMQTKSKTFYILSIILILAFCWYYFKKSLQAKNKPFQIGMIVFLILCVLIISYLIPQRFDLNRNITATRILSNRNTIWRMAWYKLSRNAITILFGLGVGSEIRWENAQTCHSVYLEIFQKFGIIGSSLFVVLTIYCITTFLKKYSFKTNLVNFIPVLILAIYSLTDTIIFPATSMMIFPLCFSMLFFNLEPKSKTN